EQTLTNAAQENPSLEVYTTLANFYSKAGRVPEAIQAIDGALAHIPPSDAATLKRYQDFRFTLVQLQNALNAAQASPNDPEAQRAVAQQWLARGQLDFALPAFERVVQLKPDDYTAQRNVALILIATDQLPRASQAITQLQPIAPSSDQVFWQRLGSILNNIQNGNANEALTQLDELAKNANLQDYALTRALQKLAEKLKATG
ncbi:MAG TPA: tetratricopeptide repeat protein, partial [Anaerolineae bacterium]|nr:tetratricopeptide repeat protein [Anaerolineae bacterium]